MSGGQKFVAGLKKFGGLNLIIGFFVALVADPQSPRLTLVVDDSCGNRYEGRDVLGNFVLINVRGRGNRKRGHTIVTVVALVFFFMDQSKPKLAVAIEPGKMLFTLTKF